MKIDVAKQQIIAACQHFKKKDFLAAADGNISYRVDQERMLITPSGRNKEFIKAEDIAMTDLSGITIAGEPSSEKLVHLHIYQTIPEAKWIMHAHPPYAIAWSLNRSELELDLSAMPEVILGAGHIPVVPYATPGEMQLSKNIAAAAIHSKTLIMQRHGALAWGETWEEAVNGIERIEHAAKVLCLALSIGGYSSLDAKELAEIIAKRALTNQTL